MAAPHLVVALSSHGYGHAAMTAPAVAALMARRADLNVTLLSALPEAWLRQRFPMVGAVRPEDLDVGLEMASPLDVDTAGSAARYKAFHAGWPQRVADASNRLAALRPDLVLANVPYLALAAAAKAGIPCAGLSSLNWLSVYRTYFGNRPEAPQILAEITEAYRAADLFLRCAPALPMPELPNVRDVGPVASVGQGRHDAILNHLGLPPKRRLAVVALGGRFPTPRSIRSWPVIANTQWLVPADWPLERADLTPLPQLENWRFADIVASADLLLTKPGYGLITEAACAGTPVLFLRRGDWPEEPGLAAWLHRWGKAHEISRADFDAGDFAKPAADLLASPRQVPILPTGNTQAAKALDALLSVK